MTVAGERLSVALLAHFDAHRRPMPWRETSDPYAIWVSEVMLQQTRVDMVRPYFVRWMRRFPTLEALAAADRDEVLRYWQGLGYYGRARNLHRAAALVRDRHGGQVPGTLAGLRALPGVGAYTAGAVASIAFGLPVPAVDGNVRRVVARLLGRPRPSPAEIRRWVEAALPPDRPGDFNQALMELGATVCLPRSPDCLACPLSPLCRAREDGAQDVIPARVAGRRVPSVTVETAVLRRGDGAVLLVRRPEDGLLGGLWEFPGDAAPPWVALLAGQARAVTALAPVRAAYSHRTVTYQPTLYALDGAPSGGRSAVREGAVAWAPLDALDRFALSVAQVRIAVAVRESGNTLQEDQPAPDCVTAPDMASS